MTFRRKATQQAGDLRGARILTVMYQFMSKPFKFNSEAKTPEDARAKVDEIVAKSADMIKVWIDAQHGHYPKLTPPVHGGSNGSGDQAQQDQDGAHRPMRKHGRECLASAYSPRWSIALRSATRPGLRLRSPR